MAKIKSIHARQILDSRGNPTVEVDVWTEAGVLGRACVPSGASTGKKEALELRDGEDKYFLGKSVLKAVGNINGDLSKLLIGQDVREQRKIDQMMIEADATENKSRYGANAILGISMACARAGAITEAKPLYRYLLEDLKAPNQAGNYLLPSPLMNIINGGSHAANNLDIQEFMIVPHMNKSFSENLRAGVEVFHALKKVLSRQGLSTNVGDEGGFAPSLEGHEMAVKTIMEAIEKAGYRPGEDISLSFDAAANEFFRETHYDFEGQEVSGLGMIEYYDDLAKRYPVYSLEDGLDEDDIKGWEGLTRTLGEKIVLVGDDLFVTNKKILQTGIENKWANAILIKVNQIGTLSETFDTMNLAFENQFKCIISHRSGETGDSFIADLAVATGCGHIKTGSASRSDRIEKYNQLLRIEEELGEQALYKPVK